ncbi:Heat shock protein 70 [Ruegeria denitrificans]|uniref:Heat shock protein 70 n=1 Tax=Ruegeria denitrificans TaxID=1715692 RepID=A0A0P1I8X6_9RHOB|nr:Hsp70 family protein [Ruegeria denitrificans]CUJ98630.1 Heat shock protein 70 [Ruegeria denitrificans]
MALNSPWIGVDFGTSNSAVAYLDAGTPRLVRFDDTAVTLPTTFFFDFDARETLIGEQANHALLDGLEGRFMRALKRVLGTPLMHEKRQILNERLTFVDIIGSFLRRLREEAEVERGVPCTRVVSGRPVVFHGADDPREAQAEADLRACYLAAGFTDIRFCFEPAAAALATKAAAQSDFIGLVVDIGGGTSDFSVFQTQASKVEILANHGVRIGGTDFDRAISIDRVMPLLGKGSMIRNVFGGGVSQAPNAIFNELATWEMIPFLYTARNRRMVEDMLRLADSPERLARLAAVLEHELGHEMAFAVERGKIAVNSGVSDPVVLLDMLEKGLAARLSDAVVAECLASHALRIDAGAHEVLRQAGLTAGQIDRVIYVGGSSLMAIVPNTMRSVFPAAEHSFASVFTAVAEGLAVVAARADE